jgi:hypothetical protein
MRTDDAEPGGVATVLVRVGDGELERPRNPAFMGVRTGR